MQVTKIVVGIDISKAKFDVCIPNQGQEDSKVFDNNKTGQRAFLGWLSKLKVADCSVCMEATGSYWQALAEQLYQQGIKVYVINPFQIKKYREHRLHMNKTDQTDARLIARFCQTEEENLHPWHPMNEESELLREMVRRLDDLKEMKGSEENRLGNASKSKVVTESLQENIALLEKQIKALENEIKDHIDKHPDLKKNKKLLESIPGIGNITAIHLLGEVDRIWSFLKASHFAAYCGLNPGRNCSGSSVNRPTRISKQGRSGLRSCLFMPAMVALRCNPMIMKLDERMTASGHTKMEIIVAAMKKLAHQIYGVLKHQTSFDPDFAAKFMLSA